MLSDRCMGQVQPLGITVQDHRTFRTCRPIHQKAVLGEMYGLCMALAFLAWGMLVPFADNHHSFEASFQTGHCGLNSIEHSVPFHMH
jgi:hypothetical protein